MSTSFGDSAPLSRGSRATLSALFVALLFLSVVWPAPVVELNDHWWGTTLSIDERSFLGREAPSWDTVFWAVAGLYALFLLQGRIQVWADSWPRLRRIVREIPSRVRAQSRATKVGGFAAFLAATAALTAATWFFVDLPLIATAEGWQNAFTRDPVRFLNRFGGGMNPPLVVGFFFVAGMVFPRMRWISLSVAMALASLTGGFVVQLLKYVVRRSRPEVWLGPFHYAGTASNSFPSGHTVGAFAIAGAIVFGTKSPTLKIVSVALACAIGASRIFAFRHWPSDVVTSSLIGLFCGWFFAKAMLGETAPEH
jgi:undecaprenyl-diphosphatase